jgi:hypothetical protein
MLFANRISVREKSQYAEQRLGALSYNNLDAIRKASGISQEQIHLIYAQRRRKCAKLTEPESDVKTSSEIFIACL